MKSYLLLVLASSFLSHSSFANCNEQLSKYESAAIALGSNSTPATALTLSAAKAELKVCLENKMGYDPFSEIGFGNVIAWSNGYPNAYGNAGYNNGYGNSGYNNGYGNSGYNNGYGNSGYNNGYPGVCSANTSLTQYGCLSQGACAANMADFNGTCVSTISRNVTSAPTVACKTDEVFTQVGCLPKINCAPGYGYSAQVNACFPSLNSADMANGQGFGFRFGSNP